MNSSSNNCEEYTGYFVLIMSFISDFPRDKIALGHFSDFINLLIGHTIITKFETI